MKLRPVCAYCGENIEHLEPALCVNATGDIIHEYCWTYYADEHINDLTIPAEPYSGEECEDLYRDTQADLRNGY